MSLYLEERIDEQKKQEENPLKDKITFTRPWIIRISPPANDNDDDDDSEDIVFHEEFETNYKFGNATWNIKLSMDEIRIETSFASYKKFACIWNGSLCFISYDLFYDNDMRFLLYSSPKIQMEEVPNADMFHTPNEFMEKYEEAFEQRKIAKIVIFVELQLPTKNFYRPCYLTEDSYKEYPNDIDQDGRFQFLKDGDFVIKCPDGEIRARRKCLKKESRYMRKHFKKSKDNELVVEHSIDVVKPIIIYFHTLCFKMPKVYDFDYVKRLLTAKEFFEPKYGSVIKIAIEHWLCNKFVKEYQDFDSILQWTSIATQNNFSNDCFHYRR